MKKEKRENRTEKLNPEICNSQHGFSLIELMIAILITALVMAGVYTTFVVQQRSFIAQDQVTETQGSSKIAFDMLVTDIRNAGYGYPEDEAPQINGFTGTVIPTDGGTNGPDTITLVGGFRDIATIGLPADQSNVEVGQKDASDNPYLDVCYTGTTRFNDTNKKYLSIDGVTYAEITNIESGSSATCTDTERLILDRPVDKAFPANRPVYLIENVTYQLNGTDLERISSASGTVKVAENIEDLEFVQIDQDADGNTDRIRVSLLARTAREDPTFDPSTNPYYPVITLEDYSIVIDPDNPATYPKNRRRIWSMEVALKN